MIKLGLPNKGRLSEKSLSILSQAGFCIQTQERKLSAFCENFMMEVIFARASDIPNFIQEGIIDLGITGQDLVEEKEADVEQIEECRIEVPSKVSSSNNCSLFNLLLIIANSLIILIFNYVF